MKKIIKLTESDLTRIVKRIIKEESENIPVYVMVIKGSITRPDKRNWVAGNPPITLNPGQTLFTKHSEDLQLKVRYGNLIADVIQKPYPTNYEQCKNIVKTKGRKPTGSQTSIKIDTVQR